MSGYKIKLLREVTAEEKLAPQQKVIYDRMLAVGVGKEIDRDTFVTELESSGTLATKQKVDRVVAYYLQDFTKKGIAESIKPEPAPKAEKPAKTAKGDGKTDGSSPADSGEKKPAKKVDGEAAAAA